MIRRLALAALFGFVACIATMLWVGSALTAPANRPVGSPPPELGASAVAIPVGSSFVKGWFAQGELGAGAVLLLHGVRSDRHQMLDRARFLREAGCPYRLNFEQVYRLNIDQAHLPHVIVAAVDKSTSNFLLVKLPLLAKGW